MIKSKALSLTLSAALIVSVAGLAGCGNANDGNTTRTNNVSTKNNGRIGGNMLRNNNNDNGMQHDLTNLKYSKTLSAKISKVKGVSDAHVFVTKDKAYVALSLDNQTGNQANNRTGSNMRSMNTDRMGGTSLGMNGTARRNDGAYGNSGTGSVGLLRGMSDPRGTLDNNTGLGRSAGTGNFGVRGNSNGGFNGSGFNTMGDNQGTGLMGTNGTRGNMDGRYGMMNNTNGNGNTSNQNSVPKDIRETVNSKIQKTVPSIDQVYVSSDAGFYDHASGYTNGNGNGQGNGNGNAVTNTVEDLGNDFGAWINRLFPLNVNGRDGMRINSGGNGTSRDGGLFNNNGQKDGLFDMNGRDNR